MQLVVGNVVLRDVVPDVLLAPLGERVGLPELVLVVPVELRRLAAARRLIAPHAGHPRVHLRQRLLERLHLANAAAGVGVRVPQLVAVLGALPREAHALVHLDLHAVAVLELAPCLVGLGEEQPGVERKEARLGLDLQQHVHDHRGLLLEGAGHVQPRVPALDGIGEDLLAHEVVAQYDVGLLQRLERFQREELRIAGAGADEIDLSFSHVAPRPRWSATRPSACSTAGSPPLPTRWPGRWSTCWRTRR